MTSGFFTPSPRLFADVKMVSLVWLGMRFKSFRRQVKASPLMPCTEGEPFGCISSKSISWFSGLPFCLPNGMKFEFRKYGNTDIMSELMMWITSPFLIRLFDNLCEADLNFSIIIEL